MAATIGGPSTRAQDEPWMAAERERRAASLRRRDERYDPAAVAPMWALFQRKLDLQSAMREEGGREGQRGSGRGKRSRGVAARSVTAAGRGAGEASAVGLLRLSGSASSRRLSGLVEPSWGLAVSCDPSNFYVCKRGMQKSAGRDAARK